MKLNIITAMAANGVIGNEGTIPWDCPEDLRNFKNLTMGCPLIMGRKTWDSLPGMLPGRPHIIITRNRCYTAPGAFVVHSLDDAVWLAKTLTKTSESPTAWVIGGAAIYEEALEIATELHVTFMKEMYYGDVFFPPIEMSEWAEGYEGNIDSELVDSYSVFKRPLH